MFKIYGFEFNKIFGILVHFSTYCSMWQYLVLDQPVQGPCLAPEGDQLRRKQRPLSW